MYFHKKFMCSQRLLTLILLISALSPFSQNGYQVVAQEKKAATLSPTTAEKILREFKALPKQQVIRNRAKAGQKLQANLARALTALSRSENGFPPSVRTSAKAILKSIRAGKLSASISNSIPNLLQNFPGQFQQNNNPGSQLESILQNVRPTSSNGIKSPIDGILNVVKTNLVGVNRLLIRILAPTPDLFQDVIQSLLGGGDALTESVAGSLNSLGPALGGVLGGGGPLGSVLGGGGALGGVLG